MRTRCDSCFGPLGACHHAQFYSDEEYAALTEQLKVVDKLLENKEIIPLAPEELIALTATISAGARRPLEVMAQMNARKWTKKELEDQGLT